MRGCPHSKHRELGACHPYLVVRLWSLVPHEHFGSKEAAKAANGRLLGCTCTTQQHVCIFDSRWHAKPARVEYGHEVALVSGSETPYLGIAGDTKFTIYDKPSTPLHKKVVIGHFWVHTAFLAAQCGEDGSGGVLTLKREEVDHACKKKYSERYPSTFELDLHFELFGDKAFALGCEQFGLVEQDEDTDDEDDALDEEGLRSEVVEAQAGEGSSVRKVRQLFT